jgi:hypothetical protein
MKSFKAEDWKEIHQQAAETKVLHLVLLGTILVSGIFDVSFPCELKATSIKKRTLKSLINKVLQAVEMDNYVIENILLKLISCKSVFAIQLIRFFGINFSIFFHIFSLIHQL